MTTEAAQAAADKAIAELGNLDFCTEISKLPEEIEGKGKWKGKGKEVATDSEDAGAVGLDMDVDAGADAEDEVVEMDLSRGVEESRKRARDENAGESSGSSKPVVKSLVQEEKEEIPAPDLGPAPDLWPAPISEEEADALDEEDMNGGVFTPSSLSLTPDIALAVLESVPTESPHRPVAHYILSNAYQQEFRTTGHTPTINSALHHAQIAVSLLAPPRRIRTNAVMNLCEIFNLRYIHTNDVTNLSAAIGMLSRTLEAGHEGRGIRPLVFHFLSRLHGYRYDALHGTDDLERCIALAEELASSIERSSGSCRVPGINIAQLHFDIGNRLREHGDIDKAIERFELSATLSDNNINLRAEALGARVDSMFLRDRNDTVAILAALQSGLEVLPASHPVAANMRRNMESLLNVRKGDDISDLQAEIEEGDGDVETLTKLSHSLLRRFKRLGDIKDLNSAVEPAEIAMAATEREDEEYVMRVGLFAHILQVRYERLGERADLDRSIETWELVVEATEGEEQRTARTNMSQALYLRHKHESGGVVDLDRALLLAQAAFDGMEKGEQEYAGRLLNLANCYTGRFRVHGTKEDIDTGISKMRQALEASAEKGSSADRPGIIGNLSAQLLLRWQAFRESRDITECIEYAERSLKETSTRSPHYAERLLNLATMLDARGHREDIERAARLARVSLESIPQGHRIEAGTMAVLARYVQHLHRGAEGLNAAVEAGEKAAAAAEVGHPDRAPILGTLAATYRARYERLGNVMDLHRAVENGYAAVAHCKESTAMKGDFLSELSESLSIRFRRIGAKDDMAIAVKTAREALDCTPVQHRSRPERLIELCQRFIESFKAGGEEENLLNAITLGNLCLEKTAQDDPDHSRRLVIVADALHLRHSVYGVFWNDLDRALIMTENALTLYRGGRITVPEIKHRMGKLLRSRYRRGRSIADINSAISWLEAAATQIDDELPVRADILDDLARSYLIRYQALENKGPDGEFSFVTFRDLWEMTLAPPLTRIRAGKRLCDVLEKSGRWSEAADIFEKCVQLMPRVSPPSLAREDQQAQLKFLFGIPTRAANAALTAGYGAERALRVLEMGRGIIMGFVINCRSETTDLQAAHPALYEEFNLLRRELDSTAGFSAKSTGLAKELEELSAGSVSARRKRAAEQLEEVLAKIRTLEGFENFLLLPTGAEMRKMAEEGPIVVYASGIDRCDAIIVTADEIKSVCLPKWEIKEAVEQTVGLGVNVVRGKVSTYARRNKKMNIALEWLWNVAVEPVLAALGIDGSEAVMPHVWWVGSGALSFAAFHAAGIHTAGSTQNTISRVISSYIPTIKALTYARSMRPPTLPRGSPNVLLVTMPTTPGESDLHGVEQEASCISEIVGADSATSLTHPTASEVLDQLASHSVIHFACHGISNPSNPSASALLLHAKDGTQDRLTVQTISDANTTTAQVAYLSACSTAENSAVQLADENIHLAAAFILAGFRNVVGTLWESSDDACVEVAGGFYTGLFVDGVGSGVAMHRAVVELRKRKPQKVLMWAPFIHMGA
jgi:tetratricopeptide (TPR) repeat protein